MKQPKLFAAASRPVFSQVYALEQSALLAAGADSPGIGVQFASNGFVTGMSITVLDPTTPTNSDSAAVRGNSTFRMEMGSKNRELSTNGKEGTPANIQGTLGPSGGVASIMVRVKDGERWAFFPGNENFTANGLRYACTLFFVADDDPALMSDD